MKKVFTLPAKAHGAGQVKFKWQKKVGHYLATSGSNKLVTIWDRHGSSVEEIDLKGNCTMMEWSNDGGMLALIYEKDPAVILWDANSKKTSLLEAGVKEPLTYLTWSKVGATLAIGTSKGNLVLYNHLTSRKIPVLGKHGNKPITAGTWSSENLLCLGGEDKTISITNENGDTLQQPAVHDSPSQIRFHEENGLDESTTVSLILGGKTLYLWKDSDPENPIELEFQAKYGFVTNYHWFGDKKILIGFSSGYFIIVSTHLEHIGQELFQSRNHKSRLTDVCISEVLNKAASCGDDSVKIHDLTDPSDIYGIIKLEDDAGQLDKMAWSNDGQLLTVTTLTGTVYTYLTKLPVLGSTFSTKICHLTALQELAVADVGDASLPHSRFAIPVEPSFIGIGPFHAAAGLNNRAWFFEIREDGASVPISQRPKEYVATVDAIQLNSDYAAALCDGRLLLHLVEGTDEEEDERNSITFPTRNQEKGRVVAFALTPLFCIYAMESGALYYFLIEDWTFVNEYRHVCGIRSVHPDPTGTRLVFIDSKGDTFLYNPVDDAAVEVPSISADAEGVLWDESNTEGALTFAVYDGTKIDTFACQPTYYRGPRVIKVGSTQRTHSVKPLLLSNGELCVLTPSGKTLNSLLDTHSSAIRGSEASGASALSCAMQNIALQRFGAAFVAALEADDASVWQALYTASVDVGDFTIAQHVCRAQGNAAMAASLQGVIHAEDRKLVAGHIAVIKGEYEYAEECFLASSHPSEALKMHRDLLHWERAIELARRMAPDEMPFISREYGQQLEFSSQFGQALRYYEGGVTNRAANRQHDDNCKAGIARMVLRSGDVRRGKALVEELDSRQLWRDCAHILQQMGQHADSAYMYERGGQFDKACTMYIHLKSWAKVGELLTHVSSTKIAHAYAVAREKEGSFKEAAVAYEQAKDYDAAIRISLGHLNDPERAVRIVKESGSVAGAKAVAKFFMSLNDAGSAIQFLVMSGAPDDAFSLAQSHGQMAAYATVLGDSGAPQDYLNIAMHYEKAGNKLEAGRFNLKGGNHSVAMRHLLSCSSSDGEHIDLAIEVAGAARMDSLTHQLINYLMGETDGAPKDAKYLFKLYMALKQYADAARTAVIIAHEDQAAGNYRNAHDTLLGMYRQLRSNDIRVPSTMSHNLMILHSYIMAKVHIKRNDHMNAARMLIRVADTISQFPAHLVNILTSTVIECWRSDLKNSAFQYAAMLMRPEYRSQIDPKYKSKLEKIVRKPEKTEVAEQMTPCPYSGCKMLIEQTSLTCSYCESIMPYDIVTGYHMTADDYSIVPCCDMPAAHAGIVSYIETEGCCPMCGDDLKPDQVVSIPDPTAVLKKFKHSTEGSAADAQRGGGVSLGGGGGMDVDV